MAAGARASTTRRAASYSVTPLTPYPSTSDVYTNMALDAPVAATSQSTPIRVRVGLGGNTTFGSPGYPDPTTSAAFTWETADQETNAEVQIGTSSTALSQTYTGYVFTSPSLGATTNFHEVHVCGLTPDTQYYYQVGGGTPGAQVWSATQSFSTMPTGTSNTPITVGVFGDARDTVSTWQAVHVRMKSAGVLMSLIPGDIVDLGEEEGDYVTWLNDIWQPTSGQFLTLGQQYIIPINGNHEADAPVTFANWAIPGDGPYAKTYNSFTVGSVHFTMIDDEQIAADEGASTPETTAQLAWIESDLAAANADRANHPFVVVLNHRGLLLDLVPRGRLRRALCAQHLCADLRQVQRGHGHERPRPRVRANLPDHARQPGHRHADHHPDQPERSVHVGQRHDLRHLRGRRRGPVRGRYVLRRVPCDEDRLREHERDTAVHRPLLAAADHADAAYPERVRHGRLRDDRQRRHGHRYGDAITKQ